ncbi:MAG: glycosyltransferase family 4 protein [Nakamurella sp.]
MTPVHVLTNAAWLTPYGGIEECTFQDSAALVSRGNRVDLVYGSDGPQRADYEAAGVSVEGSVGFGFNPWRPLRELRTFVAAARLVKKLHPDLLWLNRSEHIIWARFVAWRAHIPIVCHLHQIPNFRNTRLLYSGVTHFVAVSEFIRQAWIARGVAPEKITVLPNAVPLDRYPFGGPGERTAARDELGLPQNVPIVLYYGRISAQKGVLTLARAWRELGMAPGEALLVLLGWPSPDSDPEIARALAALPPGSYRWFEGRSGIVPFLHAADLTVVPSWAEEAFGRVVIEALATGRPVIASEIGGIPEVLSGDMSRFLVPPRDPQALAAGIRSLLNWRLDDPHLGEACRAMVEEKYPYDVHIDRLEEVLRRYKRRPPSTVRARNCRSSPNR